MRLLLIFFLSCFWANAQQDLILASIAQADVCTPDPNEVVTDAMAASDPNCNEADATTGWGSFGGTSTIASVGTDVVEGSYKIVITTPDGTSSSWVYGLPGTEAASDTFTVTFWAKTNGGCDATMSLWGNCTGGPSGVDVTTSWVEYTYNITATGNGVYLRFYPDGGGEGGCGAADDNIQIDNLSVIATN